MVRAACTQAPGGVIHTEGGDGGGAKAEARDTTSNVERNATQTHTQRTYNRGFRQNTPSALPESQTDSRHLAEAW